MRKLFPLAFLLLVTFGTTSCAIRRTVVNEHFSDLDTSSIVVGKTTWMEALAKLGPPTISKTEEGVTANLSKRHLRYACIDIKTQGFNFGYYLVFPLAWSDQQTVDATLIEFDENGLVASVSHEKMQAKWRPFQRHKNEPVTVTFDSGGH